MPDPTLTPEQIAALAQSPESVSTDGLSTTERSAADVIALDRFAAEKRATATTPKPVTGWASLRPAIAVPPGAQ
jgi:hypothetical protein